MVSLKNVAADGNILNNNKSQRYNSRYNQSEVSTMTNSAQQHHFLMLWTSTLFTELLCKSNAMKRANCFIIRLNFSSARLIECYSTMPKSVLQHPKWHCMTKDQLLFFRIRISTWAQLPSEVRRWNALSSKRTLSNEQIKFEKLMENGKTLRTLSAANRFTADVAIPNAISVFILRKHRFACDKRNDTAQRRKVCEFISFPSEWKTNNHTKRCNRMALSLEVCTISRLSFTESHLQVSSFSFVGVCASEVRSIERNPIERDNYWACWWKRARG